MEVTPVQNEKFLRETLNFLKRKFTGKIILLIVDEISKYNQAAFRNKSLNTGKALEIVMKMGKQYKQLFESVIKDYDQKFVSITSKYFTIFLT